MEGMRKRDYIYLVIGTVFITALLGGFLSPPAAFAYSHAIPPYLDPTYETPFTQLLDGTYDNAGTNLPPGVILDLEDAAVAGSRFPGIMEAFPLIAVSAIGFEAGWKIGRIIDTKWLHLSGGMGSPQTNATVSGEAWCEYGTSQGIYSCGDLGPLTDAASGLITNSSMNGGARPSAILITQYTSGCTVNGFTLNNAGSVLDPAGWTGTGSMGPTEPACLVNAWNAWTNFEGSSPPSETTVVHKVNSECQAQVNSLFGAGNYNCSVGTGSWAAFLKEKALEDQLEHGQPQTFNGQKTDVTTTMPSTSCGGTGQAVCAPSGSLTSAQLTAARAVITADPSGLNDPGWTSCELAPADYTCPDGSSIPGYSPAPNFTIPRPNPNETYDLYVARLRALGFLGSIVFLDDPGYDGLPTDAYPAGSPALELKPGTVTGVGVGTTFPVIVPIYWPHGATAAGQPQPWPQTPPVVAPTVTPTIAIMRVPAGYSPPAGTGNPPGTPGTPGVPGGLGNCNLPNIPNVDLTPLTGMDFGSKFPFGVFTWLTTVYGYFNVSAVAPSVNIDMSGLSSFVPGFSAHYIFDLTYFDTYMGTIRTLISFALWVGAVWYVGTALLGFRAGGDVSDAADDGMSDI